MMILWNSVRPQALKLAVRHPVDPGEKKLNPTATAANAASAADAVRGYEVFDVQESFGTVWSSKR